MTDESARPMGEILFYSGPDGTTRLEVLFEDESFWLTQKRMAELFAVTVPTINHHLKDISKRASWRQIERLENFEQFKRREPDRFPAK